MRVFFYKKLGITIIFDDSDNVDFVHCNKKIDINGARAGMNFLQIQEKLGKTHVKETWVETEHNKAYEIEYECENLIISFLSFKKDGTNSKLTIFRKDIS
jgi:hypothetical protein